MKVQVVVMVCSDCLGVLGCKPSKQVTISQEEVNTLNQGVFSNIALEVETKGISYDLCGPCQIERIESIQAATC